LAGALLQQQMQLSRTARQQLLAEAAGTSPSHQLPNVQQQPQLQRMVRVLQQAHQVHLQQRLLRQQLQESIEHRWMHHQRGWQRHLQQQQQH
jgi:hypothetical protein